MSKLRTVFKELMEDIRKQDKIAGNAFYSVIGIITDIDEETNKFTVDPEDGGASIKNISMLASSPGNDGMYQVPKKNSQVIVTVLGSLAYITAASNVSEVVIKSDAVKVTASVDATITGRDVLIDATRKVKINAEGSAQLANTDTVTLFDTDVGIHSTGKLYLNTDIFGGLVKIDYLLERIHNLETAMDSHVHATAATGPPSVPTIGIGGLPVGQSSKLLMENSDVVHGAKIPA